MKGKKKGGARERGGRKEMRKKKMKRPTQYRGGLRWCDDAASAYGTRMIATATDSEPTCMRSTKHKLASGDLAKKQLQQQRKQQSALCEGKMLGDPRRLSPPIPCTVCNGATTTKPQPVVTRHHLPKCPQCRCASKPTGYHLPTGGNN